MCTHNYTHARTKPKKHTYTIDLPPREQRTRPKSFHAPRSAETGRLLEISFINQTTIAFPLTLPLPTLRSGHHDPPHRAHYRSRGVATSLTNLIVHHIHWDPSLENHRILPETEGLERERYRQLFPFSMTNPVIYRKIYYKFFDRVTTMKWNE